MNYMYHHCLALYFILIYILLIKKKYLLQLQSILQRRVTHETKETMSCMFSNCTSLMTLNLSNFNTFNTINMEEMFQKCSSLTELDLSSFNTTNLSSYRNDMFGTLFAIGIQTLKKQTLQVMLLFPCHIHGKMKLVKLISTFQLMLQNV